VHDRYPGWERHIFKESGMACSSGCKYTYARSLLDTDDIVEDAIYQLRPRRSVESEGGGQYIGWPTPIAMLAFH
jgi:hypothetical protein